jgi:hypothetical protein
MANRNEVIGVVDILLAAYTNYKPTNLPALISLWTDKLSAYPEPVLRMAVDNIIDHQQWFPTFHIMREACITAAREWPPRVVNTIPVDKGKLIEADRIYQEESALTLQTLAARGLQPGDEVDDDIWLQSFEADKVEVY